VNPIDVLNQMKKGEEKTHEKKLKLYETANAQIEKELVQTKPLKKSKRMVRNQPHQIRSVTQSRYRPYPRL